MNANIIITLIGAITAICTGLIAYGRGKQTAAVQLAKVASKNAENNHNGHVADNEQAFKILNASLDRMDKELTRAAERVTQLENKARDNANKISELERLEADCEKERALQDIRINEQSDKLDLQQKEIEQLREIVETGDRRIKKEK